MVTGLKVILLEQVTNEDRAMTSFSSRKHCTMKYIKEFRTSKMCHKCAWDPKTEKMNEALFEKRNALFHGQLEQFQYDEVKN